MKSLIISLMMVLAGGTVFCDMIPKDSTEFSGKYEATALPQDSTPSWTRTTSGAVTNNIVNNMLVADSTADGPSRMLYWANSQWDSLDLYNNGFTVETSFRVISAGAGLAAFYISVGDGTSYTEVKITPSSIIWNGLSGYTAKTTDTTVGMHTIRIANEATTNAYYVWYDDELIVNGSVGKTGAVDRLWFGDWSSSIQGSYDMDYMRWTEGAYSPVPEPASMVLLVCGGMLALVAPKRKK